MSDLEQGAIPGGVAYRRKRGVMDEIEQRLNMMSVHEKETEELKWRIFKLEVQLEQDIAHYCQRAEAAEARAAERDAWAIGWKKYAKIMRRRVMELCHSVAQKDTPLIRRVIELEHDNAELQAEVERLTDIMDRIKAWIDAYPLSVFPEPDFVKARELLEAGGMTLDAVSASNMRHVLNGIKEIINADYGDAGL